jgi:hypothetical protein
MGLGFYAVYALGQRRRYVLLSASTLTALGLWVQAFLLAFREELIYGRVEVPALMYLLGTALIVFNLVVARRN